MQVENFFKEAVAILRDRHLSSYERLPTAHTFSPEFEKNIHALIAQQRRSQLRVHAGAIWRQAACFALATCLGLAACFVGVGAWSKDFLRLVEQRYPDHTSLHFVATGEGSQQTSDVRYTLTDVPEGFRRVEHRNSPDGFLNSVYFQDENDHYIRFDQSFAENISIGLNTEGSQLEQLEFRGHPARFLENNGWFMLMWYDDKYVYQVDTNLSREETMALAEKVQLKALPYPTLQTLPIESLPEQYPLDLAVENGDVVFTEETIYHLEKLEAFVAGCEEGRQDSAVRLVRYTPEGDALIDDLQMLDGRLYYTFDKHREESSEEPWEIGEEYESANLATNGDTRILLLYTPHYDMPTEVLRYQLPQGSS